MAKFENIPIDCEFPQLREIIDAGRFEQTMQQHLGSYSAEDEMHVQDCTIDQMYYKRGHNCRTVFTVNLRDTKRDQISQQIYFGKLFHPPADEKAFAAIDRRKLVQPDFGPSVIHIPEWALVAWAYPNDPRLPGLPFMLDTDRVLAAIKAAPERFGLSYSPEALSARMTKYVPGKRCGFIYLTHSNFPDGDTSCALYGKAYGRNNGEQAYMIMKRIWESEGCQKGTFILPQPYHYDAETQILWCEALSGQLFTRMFKNLAHLPELVEEIAVRLAAFHSTPLQLPEEMTLDFQVGKVRDALTAIGKTFPDYASVCSDIGHKLLNAAAQLGPCPLTPVHGSFKFGHIFATEKGIAFIDFDGANVGDPGYDLGRFIAFVYRMNARKKITPELTRQTVMNFCNAYNQMASSPVSQNRIDWFVASHLIISEVFKAVKRLNTSLVNQFLEIADRLCSM